MKDDVTQKIKDFASRHGFTIDQLELTERTDERGKHGGTISNYACGGSFGANSTKAEIAQVLKGRIRYIADCHGFTIDQLEITEQTDKRDNSGVMIVDDAPPALSNFSKSHNVTIVEINQNDIASTLHQIADATGYEITKLKVREPKMPNPAPLIVVFMIILIAALIVL